jgi:hypothetical protein
MGKSSQHKEKSSNYLKSGMDITLFSSLDQELKSPGNCVLPVHRINQKLYIICTNNSDFIGVLLFLQKYFQKASPVVLLLICSTTKPFFGGSQNTHESTTNLAYICHFKTLRSKPTIVCKGCYAAFTM